MRNSLIKLFIIIFFLVMVFFINNVVYGADLVDFSQAKVEVVFSDDTHREPALKISGVTLNPNNSYGIRYTNSITAIPQEYFDIDIREIKDKYEDYHLTELLALTDDIYIWFSEYDSEDEELHEFSTPIKLEKPEQLPLGKRISVKISAYPQITINELFGMSNRTMNYRVGKVTDIEILKGLQKNGIDDYDKLLTYAKNSEECINGNTNLNNYLRDMTIKNLGIVNEGYYFVYLKLDTENGKYIPIEDVGIYKTNVSNSIIYSLDGIDDPNFEWNLEDENEKEFSFANLKELNINNVKCLVNFDIKNNAVANIINSESSSLGNNYTLKFYKGNIEITGDTKIGTGTIIKLMDGNKIKQEYIALLYGDTTGSGSPSALDALTVVKNKLKITNFINSVYEEAGRVAETTRNSNSEPSSVDALAIVKYRLNIGTIEQHYK